MVLELSGSSTANSSLVACRRTSLTLRSACNMKSLCNDKARGSSGALDGRWTCIGLIRSVRGVCVSSCTPSRADMPEISSKEGSTHERGKGGCSVDVLTRYTLTIALTRDHNRITVAIEQISLDISSRQELLTCTMGCL